MLIPRRETPDLTVETLEHGRFDLATETTDRGTLVIVYRGLHCPICQKYLKQADGLVGALDLVHL